VTDSDNRSFVVVDGSNIATEGRSIPSLAQLDEAVRQFQQHYPDVQVIVVVDATFGHRIDDSERPAFEEAVSHAELVSPPAGAIGRGDAFLLRVAERVGAQVLSNDSFQEFHGEHPWLFREGRLIGGTRVPGVGWIFTPRSPVRGARSRASVAASRPDDATVPKRTRKARSARAKTKDTGGAKDQPGEKLKSPQAAKAQKPAKKAPAKKASAKKAPAKKAPAKKAGKAAKVVGGQKEPTLEKNAKPAKAAGAAKKKSEKSPPRSIEVPEKTTKRTAKGSARRRGGDRRAAGNEVVAAIEIATEEVLVPADPVVSERSAGSGRRKRGGPPAAVNDPLTFLRFVTEHRIGSRVEGTVASFTSHGAMVEVGDMHCYAPLAGLGDGAPRRAREVLERGERRTFVLVALDPPRRGAELALPEVAAGGHDLGA
jgi:hypothetical protein